ncbi:receptor-like protein kinase HSL1 [Hordeum vulgare]|nr:receptor-like protein kinase HSL1 [Hordeum vulgare]
MTSPRHAFLPLLALCLVLRHGAAQQADERQLLLRIKSAWGDPAELASWSAATSSHYCTGWAHVSCNGAGRVTSIALPNVTVSGPVPDAIGGLTSLATLNLSNSSVSGGFPKFLYNCTGLTYLDLSMNRLSDDLPADIVRLGENLTYLALNHNGFIGQVPPALLKLRNLTVLALSDNQFTGTIPPELGDLTGLQTSAWTRSGPVRRLDRPPAVRSGPDRALQRACFQGPDPTRAKLGQAFRTDSKLAPAAACCYLAAV